MTFQEIWTKYWDLKEEGHRTGDWSALDDFVTELAELASGMPIIPADSYEEMFNEVKFRI